MLITKYRGYSSILLFLPAISVKNQCYESIYILILYLIYQIQCDWRCFQAYLCFVQWQLQLRLQKLLNGYTRIIQAFLCKIKKVRIFFYLNATPCSVFVTQKPDLSVQSATDHLLFTQTDKNSDFFRHTRNIFNRQSEINWLDVPCTFYPLKCLWGTVASVAIRIS